MTVKRPYARLFAAVAALGLLCFCPARAAAREFDAIAPGSYPVQASLSCHVSAMGGVEFGAPLLTGAEVTAAADGSRSMTLCFTKSSVTIYGVTCDTFVDDTPAQIGDAAGPARGTLGYYDAAGALQTEGVRWTHSAETALDPQNNEKHYVDSLTFPLTHESDTYALALFINSNVMGTQFSADTYPAALQVDWDSLLADGAAPAGAGADASAEAVPPEETAAPAAPDGSGAPPEETAGLRLYPAEPADGAAQEAPRGETAQAAPARTSASESISGPAAAGRSRVPWAVGAGLMLLGVALVCSEKKRKES